MQFKENAWTDRRTKGWTDGRTEGQTLFYRNFPATTEGPKTTATVIKNDVKYI